MSGKEVIASPEEVGQGHVRMVDLVKGQLQENYCIAGNFRERKFRMNPPQTCQKNSWATGS